MKKINCYCLPYCNSNNLNYKKEELKRGILYKNNQEIYFETNSHSDINCDVKINFNEIEKIETVNLNLVQPMGIIITLKNNQEYVFGHHNNKKLKDFIIGTSMQSTILKKIVRFIIFLLIFLIPIFNVYQENKEEQERLLINLVNEIDSMDIYKDSIDMDTISNGDYAYIEKTIKEYYTELFTNKKEYFDKDAQSTLNIVGVTSYLKKNKNNLEEAFKIIEENKKKSDEALKNIINILNVENTINRINKYNLSNYYIEFYKDLILYGTEEKLIKDWEEVRKENEQKYTYVSNMLFILDNFPEDWYVEDDNLYITDDYNLERYNYFYDLVFDSDEENDEQSDNLKDSI